MRKIAKSKIFHDDFLEKNRKGELTTQQLVTIIILIVSFSVLLFFIFRLNLGGETTNKEICHNSVLLKSKQSFGGALDCRTNYICISGGDKCEDFSATETVKIDMSGSDADKKNRVMKAIADEMVDCWWMFGEGKVDYADSSIWDKVLKVKGDKVCSVCSRIKFDKQIKSLGLIEKSLFENTLINSKKGGDTYLYYLYGTHDIKQIDPKSISLDKEYSVITGIAKKSAFEKIWKSTLIGAPNQFWNTLTFGFYGKTYSQATNDEKGPIPIRIIETSQTNSLACTEFLTKA